VKISPGIIAGILFASLNSVTGQISLSKTLGSETHSFAQVFDSVYGIQFYGKYNPAEDGYKVRKFSDGTMCNNMIDDYYPDGKIVHKGFYTAGVLTEYINFYPDGKVERVFKPVTERKTELKKFYQNEVLKSDVVYYDGNSTLWQDYYDNGQLSYIEEYDKKHQQVLRRCSYFRDGKPESIFMPVDSKSKDGIIRYSLKEYFPNGQLKEESTSIYSPDSYDFLKDGDAKQYDDKGNVVAEYIYVGGVINQTIK
jgi:antitoxin component YwqK of YwqJK toxin-antitoxin module